MFTNTLFVSATDGFRTTRAIYKVKKKRQNKADKTSEYLLELLYGYSDVASNAQNFAGSLFFVLEQLELTIQLVDLLLSAG